MKSKRKASFVRPVLGMISTQNTKAYSSQTSNEQGNEECENLLSSPVEDYSNVKVKKVKKSKKVLFSAAELADNLDSPETILDIPNLQLDHETI
jgi:hypothetical protein